MLLTLEMNPKNTSGNIIALTLKNNITETITEYNREMGQQMYLMRENLIF